MFVTQPIRIIYVYIYIVNETDFENNYYNISLTSLCFDVSDKQKNGLIVTYVYIDTAFKVPYIATNFQ